MSTKKIMVKIMVETFLLDILSALLGADIKLCPRILLWKVTLPILNLFLQMKSAHEQYLGHNLNSAPAKSIVCTKSCTMVSQRAQSRVLVPLSIGGYSRGTFFAPMFWICVQLHAVAKCCSKAGVEFWWLEVSWGYYASQLGVKGQRGGQPFQYLTILIIIIFIIIIDALLILFSSSMF